MSNYRNPANSSRVGQQGRMRIRAFPMSMDENYVNQIWAGLKAAIQEIQRKNNSGLSFEELYRNAYTMVLHKFGERLYNGLKEVVTDHLITNVREEVLKSLNDNFLHTLNNSWNDHQTSMVMIRDILMYMDRVYVQQNHVRNVYDLGLILFRDDVLHHERIRAKVQETLLDMLCKERAGDAIEKMQIRNACQMLMALGIDGSREVYEADFEREFLKQTSQFFKTEAQKILAENSASIYINKVHERLREEAERAKHYLDPSSEGPVREVVKRELVTEHLNTIVDMEDSGVLFMIQNCKYDDLKRMYELFDMVEGGVDCMRSAMSAHLRHEGQNLWKQCPERGAIQYIENLIQLKDEYDKILAYSFKADKRVKQMITADFEFFLNKNNSSPEYLSLFIDEKLRKGTKESDDDMNKILDKAMTIFRFLEEKDVFERYYKQHLAKRLLFKRSTSDEIERNMLIKLKQECGTQFTCKLEGMFKDMTISANVNDEYRNCAANFDDVGKNVDLTVHVLTTGFWPMPAATSAPAFPAAAEEAYQRFSTFYLNKHQGRVLTLQGNLGHAELEAYFYCPPGTSKDSESCGDARPCSSKSLARPRKHIFQCNTYQMVVLMMFNEAHVWTYEDILKQSKIPEKELVRTLQSLALGKLQQRVLTKSPKTKEIEKDHLFSINEGYTHKLHKVKIAAVVAKGETEPERTETREKVEGDRKHEIEAAIVRVMKSRKSLEMPQLVSEVIDQLKQRFQPSPVMIKKRAEDLITRDYLTRDNINRKLLLYQA